MTHRTRIRVHLGTAEALARVLPRDRIDPGSRGLARLALETPLVARGGDRFVIRSYSPVSTIGGGVVLDPLPPSRRAKWSVHLAAAEPAERLAALVERRPGGLATQALPVLLGIPGPDARAAALRAPVLTQVGDLWVTQNSLRALGAVCLALLRRHHREHPLDRGLPLQTLRRSLRAPEAVIESVLDDLVRTGRMRKLGGLAALAGFTPTAAGGEGAVAEMVALVEEAGLTPPSVAELERRTGRRDAGAILRLAASTGKVVAIEGDRYYSRAALERFVAALRWGGGADVIVPSELRQRLGISRKYLIPLLEWADAQGFTAWEGDVRRARLAGPA